MCRPTCARRSQCERRRARACKGFTVCPSALKDAHRPNWNGRERTLVRIDFGLSAVPRFETDDRVLRIGRFGIEVEHILHAGDVFGIDLRSRQGQYLAFIHSTRVCTGNPGRNRHAGIFSRRPAFGSNGADARTRGVHQKATKGRPQLRARSSRPKFARSTASSGCTDSARPIGDLISPESRSSLKRTSAPAAGTPGCETGDDQKGERTLAGRMRYANGCEAD